MCLCWWVVCLYIFILRVCSRGGRGRGGQAPNSLGIFCSLRQHVKLKPSLFCILNHSLYITLNSVRYICTVHHPSMPVSFFAVSTYACKQDSTLYSACILACLHDSTVLGPLPASKIEQCLDSCLLARQYSAWTLPASKIVQCFDSCLLARSYSA